MTLKKGKSTVAEGDVIITLSPDDSWLDCWCRSQYGMNFGLHLHRVETLPDDNVNKPELVRYVERLRRAMHDRNFEAVEGWANALAVAVKSAGFLIPLATAKQASDEATSRRNRMNAKELRGGCVTPERVKAHREAWLADPRRRGSLYGWQTAAQLDLGIDRKTLLTYLAKAEHGKIRE